MDMKEIMQTARILQTIDNDIDMCKAWASYHIALATTGVTKRRNIYHGFHGDELTDDEKVEDSLNTACQHLHNMSELIDKKKELLNKFPDDPESLM